MEFNNVIKANVANVVRAHSKSMSPMKVVTEYVDNMLQYAPQKQSHVIVDEAKKSVYFVDNGKGFNDTSYSKYHEVYAIPDDASGCSRYGVGSKIFGSLAPSRSMLSFGKNGDQYDSKWDQEKDILQYNPLSQEEKSELEKIFQCLNFKHGTIIKLERCNWGEGQFKSASSFYKRMQIEFKQRYQYRLFKTRSRLKIILITSKGQKQTHDVVPKDIFSNARHMNSRTHHADGVSIKFSSFVAPDPRGVSMQGIDVYYDYFKIDTKNWIRLSRDKIMLRSKHNHLNHCRQVVFLNSDNSRNVSIDLNKTGVTLPEQLNRKLAADCESIYSALMHEARKRSKENIGNTEGKKYKFGVGNRLDYFVEDYAGSPWCQDDNKGVIINTDTTFFSRLSEMKTSDQLFVMSIIETMYIACENRRSPKAVTRFIKDYSDVLECKLD